MLLSKHGALRRLLPFFEAASWRNHLATHGRTRASVQPWGACAQRGRARTSPGKVRNLSRNARWDLAGPAQGLSMTIAISLL
jgi:hypothetical protein